MAELADAMGVGSVLCELLALDALGALPLQTGERFSLSSGIEAQQPTDTKTQEPSPAPGPRPWQ